LYQCPAPPGLVGKLLLTGRALVIFDGLDELLDTSRRANVTTRVERFCTEYPLAQALVTSRLVGYDQARLDDRQFASYRLGDFGDDQVSEYVRKWFAQEDGIEEAGAERWATAFLEESAGVPDLRANPLMLSLMCILYRGEGSLPRDRAEVYDQCATLLFRKWDARRRIHLDLRAGHLLEPALQHLAWWLFTRSKAQSAVTERELVDETTNFLHGRGFESEDQAKEAAYEFVDFCRGRMWVFSDTGTTATGEALYSFTHRTFQEYFAAAHIAYSCDTPERLADTLAPRVARVEWEVAAELAVQIKDKTSHLGAQRVYTVLLGERRRAAKGRSGVLQFLARCIRSVDPSPGIVRELTREILDHLFAGDLNDPVRHLPLSWLLASCANYRNIVSDSIRAKIAAMVQSGDPSIHLNGLRLTVWLANVVAWHPDEGYPCASGMLLDFWQECAAENSHIYADLVVAAAAHDTGIRHAALFYGLITVNHALELPGGLLPLFQGQSIGIGESAIAPYLMTQVRAVALGWYGSAATPDLDSPDRPVADLADFGYYLLNHPRLPWVTGSPMEWLDFFRRDLPEHEVQRPDLDSATYLGAAATLLITTEVMAIAVLPKEARQRLGPLSDLYPYIARRRLKRDNQLPELPVPEGFRQVFRDWADGKVDFVGQADADEGPASE
jgi:hypothetical protein